MKYYLAHSLAWRKMVRKIEHILERMYDIELVNPFYDVERDEIQTIDEGLITPYDSGLDYFQIVKKDLDLLHSCDGILAFVTEESGGTWCEIWEGYKEKKPVFVIARGILKNHVWIKYIVANTHGRIFEDFLDLMNYLDKHGKLKPFII